MTAAQFISLSITIAGFIIGIITSVAKLAAEYGKLKKEVEQNANRDKEERDHTREKFTKLYAITSSHETTLAGLQNNVTNLTSTCERIEAKLDRLIEKETK